MCHLKTSGARISVLRIYTVTNNTLEYSNTALAYIVCVCVCVCVCVRARARARVCVGAHVCVHNKSPDIYTHWRYSSKLTRVFTKCYQKLCERHRKWKRKTEVLTNTLKYTASHWNSLPTLKFKQNYPAKYHTPSSASSPAPFNFRCVLHTNQNKHHCSSSCVAISSYTAFANCTFVGGNKWAAY
jgi:hypothetical protein